MNEIILKTVRSQQTVLEGLIQGCLKYGVAPLTNKEVIFERAKFLGMLDLLDALKIERSEFSWIFYI